MRLIFATALFSLLPLILAANVPIKYSLNEPISGAVIIPRNFSSTTGHNSTASSTGTGSLALSSGSSNSSGTGKSGTGVGASGSGSSSGPRSGSGSGSGVGSNTTTGSTSPSKPSTFQGAASTTVAGFSVICGAAAFFVFALM